MAWPNRQLLAVFAVAALAACSSGGGSDAGSGPTIATFTATPSSLPTAGGSVTLAWAVTGATSLSIDHGVGAVSPVTSGSTSVQVTATTTFTLTATGSSGTSTQTAAVTVAAPIVVAGTVADEYGSPLSGETVLITSGAFSQSAVSDANGAFSVPNVPTPYNATVLGSGGKTAVQYQGLTRADPTLYDLVVASPARSAMVSGQLTGATFPLPTDYSANVTFASPQTTINTASLNVATDGTYSGSVNWAGGTTTTGTLYALGEHVDGSGLPLDYGYGSLPNVLLQDLGTLAGQNIALNSVTTGTVSGTVTPPTGFTLLSSFVYFQPGAGALFTLVDENGPSASFNYILPNITNATSTLVMAATGTPSAQAAVKKVGLGATESGLSLTIPAPPTLSLPVDSATGVTLSTPFTWTNYTGVYLVFFTPSTGTDPTYYVFTASQTATIPDLTAQGLPLPATAGYSWQMYAIGPNTSVDNATSPGGLLQFIVLTDGYYAISQQRSFTTGP
jgi:hypothetical protein